MGDFVKQLPDDICHSIISYLAPKDVIRAATVSRCWWDLYSSFSPQQLELDLPTMFNADTKQGVNPLSNDQSLENPCHCVVYKDKFVSRASQLLGFYHNARVKILKFSFCLGVDDTHIVDQCVGFAAKAGVEDLWLNFCCYPCLDNDCLKDENSKYVVRSEIFQVASLNLKMLRLFSCVLEPNLFSNAFGCLDTLILFLVPLGSYDLVGMFSVLESLKKLVICECSLPSELCLDGSKLCLLENFKIILCHGIQRVEISNMKNLNIFDCLCREVVQWDFITPLPRLKMSTLSTGDIGMGFTFTQLPICFPRLFRLSLHSSRDWAKFVPKSITRFNHVITLKLIFDGESEFDIVKLIRTLHAFPILGELVLWTHCKVDREKYAELPKFAKYKCLETVKIGGFVDTNDQLRFLAYLITNTVRLKELVIKREVYVPFRCEEEIPVEESVRQKVLARIAKLSCNRELQVII